jgi:virulence factor
VFTKLATLSTIEASGAVLIIRLPDADTAESVAHAAIEGGYRALELTLSIPGAVDLIHRLAAQYRSLDAVFVLTLRSEHAHAVDACLRRDVDVFCEKPLAPSADEAERLADLADQHGRILMVDFNRRYTPVYVAGRDTFGSAGATFCVAEKNRPGSEYRATFENAIHMVDLLRWYCGGEAVEVTAHAAGDDPWQEDGTAAIIRFDSGNTGVLLAARTAGAWNEKLDAYGAGRSAEVRAPESVSITVDGVTTTRDLSSEAFGWATATETLGFAAAVHHFLDRRVDRGPALDHRARRRRHPAAA